MNNRILVLYYSHSRTTKKVAEMLMEKTQGDLYELHSEKVYDPDMWKADAQSKADREAGSFPALVGTLPELKNYDTILIGGPVWGGTLANPLATYLNETDFGGKTVAGFWSFIDYEGNYSTDFMRQCKNADVKDGLGLTTSRVRSSDLSSNLDTWLKYI